MSELFPWSPVQTNATSFPSGESAGRVSSPAYAVSGLTLQLGMSDGRLLSHHQVPVPASRATTVAIRTANAGILRTAVSVVGATAAGAATGVDGMDSITHCTSRTDCHRSSG